MLKNNRTPLLCYLKLCASFLSQWQIQTGVTVWKRPIWVQIDDFFSRVTLQLDVWLSKTIGHLFYATSSFVHPFCSHWWIHTGVTVRKRLSWVVTFVTLTFDFWPWPFAWPSILSLVVTPENFMMIRWWKRSQKGVTDRRTDGRTEPFIELLGCS